MSAHLATCWHQRSQLFPIWDCQIYRLGLTWAERQFQVGVLSAHRLGPSTLAIHSWPVWQLGVPYLGRCWPKPFLADWDSAQKTRYIYLFLWVFRIDLQAWEKLEKCCFSSCIKYIVLIISDQDLGNNSHAGRGVPWCFCFFSILSLPFQTRLF